MFEVLLSRQARRYYASVDATVAKRLEDVFKRLESDPFPEGTAPLHGELRGFWRMRVGQYRVIYDVNERDNVIRIVRIGPRGDVY
ncbi:MAG: type II toxin-antitoxin system RelE/ParE family toxin [Candidatus Hydrogenedentes bacterium]|nr:type II toxin-antitoxin system RelE/ParE family toxin [Candidatus Hydrogenedentota bacterium]